MEEQVDLNSKICEIQNKNNLSLKIMHDKIENLVNERETL